MKCSDERDTLLHQGRRRLETIPFPLQGQPHDLRLGEFLLVGQALDEAVDFQISHMQRHRISRTTCLYILLGYPNSSLFLRKASRPSREKSSQPPSAIAR